MCSTIALPESTVPPSTTTSSYEFGSPYLTTIASPGFEPCPTGRNSISHFIVEQPRKPRWPFAQCNRHLSTSQARRSICAYVKAAVRAVLLVKKNSHTSSIVAEMIRDTNAGAGNWKSLVRSTGGPDDLNR